MLLLKIVLLCILLVNYMDEKQKILIVDDEAGVLTLLESVLTSSGFQVLKASDGSVAVSIVGKEHPALVLLDLNMPNLNGFETCRALRKDPQNHNLPIVILTGKNTESDIVHALDSGADDYINKPFDQGELIKKINHLLAKAKTGKLPSQQFFNK